MSGASLVAVDKQRAEALLRANESRQKKARLKADLKTIGRQQGLRLVAERLESHPDTIGPFKVEELVQSVRQIGRSKVRDICKEAELVGSKRVRSLSERQRLVLAQVLRARALR